MTKCSHPGVLRYSTTPHAGSGRNLNTQEYGSVPSLGTQISGKVMPINKNRKGLLEERGGGQGKESCKLVILGHPVKPKHLRNAARFIFRTEFMRFRKGAYKRHSTLQTILKAFWPEPITLKASNFFHQAHPSHTPPCHRAAIQ